MLEENSIKADSVTQLYVEVICKKNPYTISFGKIPTKYLSRNYIIDTITEALEDDEPDEQAF